MNKKDTNLEWRDKNQIVKEKVEVDFLVLNSLNLINLISKFLFSALINMNRYLVIKEFVNST